MDSILSTTHSMTHSSMATVSTIGAVEPTYMFLSEMDSETTDGIVGTDGIDGTVGIAGMDMLHMDTIASTMATETGILTVHQTMDTQATGEEMAGIMAGTITTVGIIL